MALRKASDGDAGACFLVGSDRREERKVVDDTEGASALGSDLPSVSADVRGGASRLDAVFDLVPLGIGILDLHGHMTSAN